MPSLPLMEAVMQISTHMPLARHDDIFQGIIEAPVKISTHMPLARHDNIKDELDKIAEISTHMPLARHDGHLEFHQFGTH